MSVNVGLLVTLEAKPGKEDEVAAFLNGGLALVEQEPGTVTWYAFRQDQSTFGIFDTFGTDDGRQAHLSGAVAAGRCRAVRSGSGRGAGEFRGRARWQPDRPRRIRRCGRSRARAGCR